MKNKSLFFTIILSTAFLYKAFSGDLAPAPEAKDLQALVEEIHYVEASIPSIMLSGYIDAGYLYNFTSGHLNGRNSADGYAQGDFNLNQLKLVLEKGMDDKNVFQSGFRADVMFGEDSAALTGNASGSPDGDSLYLQQAYITLRMPIGNGVDLSIGKWQQPLGFEAEERGANINITYGYSSLGDPGGTIGIIAKYPINDDIEALLGINNGSGADDHAGLDTTNDGYAITGQLNYHASDNTSWSNGFYYAWDGDPGYGSNDSPVIGANTMGTWLPEFADGDLLLAYNFTYVHISEAAPGSHEDSNYYGTGLYGKYKLSDIVSLGGRAEYAHMSDNRFVDLSGGFMGSPNLGSNDLWSWTATLGFDLLENLLIRTEYRFDLGNDTSTTTSGGTFHSDDKVHTLATEIIYSF